MARSKLPTTRHDLIGLKMRLSKAEEIALDKQFDEICEGLPEAYSSVSAKPR